MFLDCVYVPEQSVYTMDTRSTVRTTPAGDIYSDTQHIFDFPCVQIHHGRQDAQRTHSIYSQVPNSNRFSIFAVVGTLASSLSPTHTHTI